MATPNIEIQSNNSRSITADLLYETTLLDSIHLQCGEFLSLGAVYRFFYFTCL